MLVAETDMDSRSQEASTSGSDSDSNSSPAGKGDGAFNTLAKYIFGGNAAGARMSMTTPVFSDNRGAMQFVIEPGYRVRLPSKASVLLLFLHASSCACARVSTTCCHKLDIAGLSGSTADG